MCDILFSFRFKQKFEWQKVLNWIAFNFVQKFEYLGSSYLYHSIHQVWFISFWSLSIYCQIWFCKIRQKDIPPTITVLTTVLLETISSRIKSGRLDLVFDQFWVTSIKNTAKERRGQGGLKEAQTLLLGGPTFCLSVKTKQH